MESFSSDLVFYLRKVLGTLVLPPLGPFIVAFAGLLLLNRSPKLGRALAWLGFTALLVLSLPLVSKNLLKALEDSGPLNFAAARTAQAIVVPGGGLRHDALEYDGDTVGQFTLERVRYGAWVARRTGLPVLVSGGVVFDGSSEAQVMQKTLADEFGVAVKWAEAQSRNTHENALRSAEILRGAGVRRIVLISHGLDMRRARAEFEAAGMEVVPAPTMLTTAKPSVLGDLIPSAGALRDSYFALYELLANAVRHIGM
jgi:uncharacterized SAM-binding protein YcdF (DUF218 family)